MATEALMAMTFFGAGFFQQFAPGYKKRRLTSRQRIGEGDIAQYSEASMMVRTR